MSKLKLTSAGLLLVVLASCQDQPTSLTTEQSFTPLFQAVTTKSEELVEFDFVTFVPCANGGAGEDVHFQGGAFVRIHTTVTPSGNVIVNFKIPSLPSKSPVFTATGLTTGTVYTFDHGFDGFNDIILKGGVTEVFHMVNVEHYISETGESLDLQATLHVIVDADGVTVIEHGGWTCRS